ncbi:MAG TPA: 16S rRNA (cytosine(967)-C(5))-methyltransferase RsmB [Candidatus Acidoferrales bacterium]|nr:16S rRNA (cytosine(967)-C(5))-methyltransferase RsmB [Candidatus Acidoferrales bacterium]
MRVTRARQIAFEVLRRVEEGSYATDLLHARRRGVKHEDAALATELTLGVLRWQRLLDFLLARHLAKPVASLDTGVLLALRLGLYQLRFLTRVPARAAVSESVELVRHAGKSSAASLVNAVLRRAASATRESPEELGQRLPPDIPLAERLGIRYSHPTWMVERWLSAFGEQRSVALLEANNRPSRVTCAVADAACCKQAISALRKSGLGVKPGRLLRSALTVGGGNPAASEAFRRGWISIQDEASQLIALALGVERGQSVLDLCAAPGGKTALLARAAGPDALVIAADRHVHRLRAMKEQMRRVGAAHVGLLALDATGALPFSARFDCILVDAPCSGTGTLSRNPEIRWRLRPEDFADFHSRQTRLLVGALETLAPGGRLVYSTCSLESEENEQVVEEVVANRGDIRRGGDRAALAPHLAEGVRGDDLFDRNGYLRTFPPDHHTDGFFAAILAKSPLAGLGGRR